jgi:hypothetical protein
MITTPRGVGRADDNGPVTEDLGSSRQSPKRPPVRLEELELLVRVPGRPEAIRAFTGSEQAEAGAYAAAVGGSVEPLHTTSSL